MRIDEAVYTYLSGYAGLTALVGKRIYPDIAPQQAIYPCLTYQMLSEEEVNTFTQPNSTMIGVVFSFSVWGSTRASSKAASEQLRLAFKNYSGVTGGVGGVTVSGVEKLGSISDIDIDSDGKIIAYKTIMDFKIWYQE